MARAKRNRVSQNDFIRAVFAAKQNGDSYAEVAEQLGLAENTVRARITKMRNQSKPIPLPTLGSHQRASEDNTQAAIDLCAELTGDTEATEAESIRLQQVKAKRDAKRSRAQV